MAAYALEVALQCDCQYKRLKHFVSLHLVCWKGFCRLCIAAWQQVGLPMLSCKCLCTGLLYNILAQAKLMSRVSLTRSGRFLDSPSCSSTQSRVVWSIHGRHPYLLRGYPMKASCNVLFLQVYEHSWIWPLNGLGLRHSYMLSWDCIDISTTMALSTRCVMTHTQFISTRLEGKASHVKAHR